MFYKLVTATVSALLAVSASAQHAHSDVDAIVESGKIVFEGPGLVSDGSGFISGTGSRVYEAEFGAEFGSAANETDDPGFNLEDFSFTPGDFLAFDVVNTLSFWDGASWLTSTPGSETLSITDVVGTSTTTVSDSLITNSLGLIDQSDGDGGVHTHLEFLIDSNATAGTYLLEFILRGFSDSGLTNEAYTASDSVFIAFNFGLTEESFETSIDALGVTAAVPVPAAWLFLASGLGALVMGRRLKV